MTFFLVSNGDLVMLEPESGKPGNLSALLGSAAALMAAISAWLYSRSGKSPRPEAKAENDRRWISLLEKLEEINQSLSDTHSLASETNEKVIRLEVRFEMLGRRLARVEAHQEPAGD